MELLLFLTTVIYEQSCRCWDSNPDPLARAADALTTEQPLQHPAVRVLTKSLLSKSYSASTSGFSFGFVFCFLFETVLLCGLELLAIMLPRAPNKELIKLGGRAYGGGTQNGSAIRPDKRV